MSREEERILLQNFVRRAMNDPRTNDWEKEFLVSVNSKIAGDKELTEKQQIALNKIKQKCKNPL